MVRSLPCIAIAAVLCLSACTRHVQYRTHQPQPPFPHGVLPEDSDIEIGGKGYLLGVAEFDDQGAYWNRDQVLGGRGLIRRLEQATAGKDMLLVVFVHGWQNNARYDNGNLAMFRGVLAYLQGLESASPREPRQVVGIYVGWRGRSVPIFGVTHLTFWARKNTADKIGRASVFDLLRHLEAMHERRHREHHAGDRFVVIGHSFGAAIVFAALSQIFVDRYIEAEQLGAPLRSFGDLVLLVNPAFEAQRYDSLQQLEIARKRDGKAYPQQLPVLTILTSESDLATKLAFPVGRYVSTFLEKYATPAQKQKNWQAVGHYEPFKNYRLRLDETAMARPVDALESPKALLQLLADRRERWLQRTKDTPCEARREQFARTVLSQICGAEVPLSSPYLVVEVDRRISDGHSDIDNPLLVEFMQEFVIFAVGGDH